MPTLNSYDYAVIRVVPQVERGEFINVGLILICRARRFLAARLELDRPRLMAFWPQLNLELVQSHLELIPRICAGGHEAGPIGLLSQAERFHWLVAPRSTIIQISPVHSGFCHEPAPLLDHLLETLVKLPT